MKPMKERKTMVLMPKFKMEKSYDKLHGTLAAMGMPTAFRGPADYSGMGSKEQLFIDQVIHKASINVNDQGTEAAAITGLAPPGASIRDKVPSTPAFRSDRPFIFLIRDRERHRTLPRSHAQSIRPSHLSFPCKKQITPKDENHRAHHCFTPPCLQPQPCRQGSSA